MAPLGVVERSNPVAMRWLFEGQSHNFVPADTDPDGLGYGMGHSYPWHLTRGRNIPWGWIGVAGVGWEALLDGAAPLPYAPDYILPPPSRRAWPYMAAGLADVTVVLISEGTTDINSGSSAQQVYDWHVEYADLARTNGADIIVVCDLIRFAATAPVEAAQVSLNTLLHADAEDAFDAVAPCDAALVARWGSTYWLLDPPADAPYFDGGHMFGEASELYAQTVADVLLPLL